jgi:predicted RecB family nuclease
MKQQRVCPQGHTYFKSSDCRSCPRCEAAKKPAEGFLSELAAPARRALEGAGLTTLAKLAARTESQVAALHGMGPNALARLRASLKKAGRAFRKS